MTNHEDAEHLARTNGPPTSPETIAILCGGGSCPTVYETDRDTVLVQGVVATGVTVGAGEQVVEIPRELLIEAAQRMQSRGA